MADRPILFSAPMVRALVDGRKTQTRRIFKGAEQNESGLWHVFCSGGGVVGVTEADVGKEAVNYLPIQVGDRLWVRETWSGHHVFRDTPPSQRASFTTPDGPYPREDVWFWADGEPAAGDYEKPRPGIHMPRWASRLTLTVTAVRVERLQDINEDDAIAEGIEWVTRTASGDFYRNFQNPTCPLMAYGAYRSLWDSINGDGAWDANPWVAVYDFKVFRSNIDEVANG